MILQFSPLVRRIKRGAGDRLEYIEGSGVVVTLFGLPFLCLGLFLLRGLVFRLIPLMVQFPLSATNVQAMLAGFIIVGPLGTMFSFFGVLAVFGRDVVLIDKQARTVSTWRSILWFRRPTSYNLDDFTDIAVERRIRRGGRSWHYVYAVDLRGPSERVEVVALRNRKRSAEAAREIAELLGMNWADAAQNSGSAAH
jgi:hypothetical protein